jgi:hypothetical protein
MYIGITTSFRKESTLETTLNSLDRSGFKFVHIFADHNTIIDDGVNVSRRKNHQYGAWRNWFWGLKELYETYEQEFYVMCQDDILVCGNLYKYILQLKPNGETGLYSLCTPPMYKGPNLWNEINQGSKLWLAQFVIIPRNSVKMILESKEVWRFNHGAAIDNRLGMWAKYAGKKVLYHTPSLVNHIGHISTIWPDDIRVAGERSPVDFPGEDFDSLTLLRQ